jgi:glycosyltransferase involved in cell wall biosynthesis
MFQFSILIPTWNNLPHLKLCLSSIQKNSYFSNQIIVFANEGNDGTPEWLKTQEGIKFLHSPSNEGVCKAMNACRSLITTDYIIYLNDDMYVCPNWDLELYKEIERIGHDRFMISSTLIEPHATRNANLVSIIHDFGDSIATFREDELLKSYLNFHKDDWCGSSWPPSVVSTRVWDIIGGYSIEFSPGMYSDPDLSMKLWNYGIRIFKGVGSSKVYHFQSKSTKRLRKNKGSNKFLMKWGITARTFYKYYLAMGEKYNEQLLHDARELPFLVRLKNKLKRTYVAFLGN